MRPGPHACGAIWNPGRQSELKASTVSICRYPASNWASSWGGKKVRGSGVDLRRKPMRYCLCERILLIAVGTRVTPRPPHRSGQAQLRHPAPASGNWRQVAPRPVACGPTPVTRLPGPVPGTCFAGPLSPWPPSLAPPAPRRITPLCSSASLLLRRSQTSRVRASSASTPRLPDADLGAFALRPNPRPPGSRAKSFHTCQGLRPRRAGRALAITRPSISPSVFMTTSAPETILLSRLNGWPMYSPVNASSASSRIPTHELGADAVCYSFIAADFHRLLFAGFYRRTMKGKSSALSPPALLRRADAPMSADNTSSC